MLMLRQVVVALSHLKREEFKTDLKLVLIVVALWHVVMHIAVLFGAHSIEFMSGSWFMMRQLYFTFDFAVSPAIWVFTRKNTSMVVVHALVHIFAALHLYGIYPTKMYSDIFEMAESNYDDKMCWVVVYYVWMTTQDLVTHLTNAIYLIQLENKNPLSYFSKPSTTNGYVSIDEYVSRYFKQLSINN
eukprot:101951_1